MSGSLTKAVLERAVPAALAGWLVVTMLVQHPDRSYDKLRMVDRSGTGIFIPNWRFFGPNPAVEDHHFLYRLASEDRTKHTEWRQVYSIAPRRLVHAIWFPGRRLEKAVFDVASTLLNNTAGNTPLHKEAKLASYRLLNAFVRARLTPEPGYPLFQAMLVRYTGYDHSEDPKYDMVLDYERVNP